MVTLVPCTEEYEAGTLRRMAAFFGFHAALVSADGDVADEWTCETLRDWRDPPNELYVILEDGTPAGFLHLCYRGPIAAWIEDIFVDEERRGRGIASAAIGLAEDEVRARPGYEAVCMDVAPRNESALRLYHRLGYTDLSLLTLRKELGQSRRDRPVKLLGHDFHY